MNLRQLSSIERDTFRKRGLTLIKLGKRQKEVAKILGVREATVSSWVKQHREYGNKGLQDNNWSNAFFSNSCCSCFVIFSV